MQIIGSTLLLRLAFAGSWVAMSLLMGCASVSSSRPIRAASVIEGAPLPISTAGHAGGIVAGTPVVVGGSHWSDDKTTKRWLHECFVYGDGKWSPGPSYPTPMSDGAYAFGPQGLHVAGGTDGKNASKAVRFLTGKAGALEWQSLPDFPEAIEAAVGAFANDTFYVVGGFSAGKASNRLWALSVGDKQAKWLELAALPAPGRGYAAFVAVGKYLYLLGGFTSPPYQTDVVIFDDAYRYDPSSNKWEKVDGLNLPGYAWTASAVNDHQILLTGRVARISETTSDILLLDLKTLSVKTIGNLLTPNCCMPAIPVAKDTWWMPGGEPETNRSRSARTSIVTLKR